MIPLPDPEPGCECEQAARWYGGELVELSFRACPRCFDECMSWIEALDSHRALQVELALSASDPEVDDHERDSFPE